jgi:hypothetical protein
LLGGNPNWNLTLKEILKKVMPKIPLKKLASKLRSLRASTLKRLEATQMKAFLIDYSKNTQYKRCYILVGQLISAILLQLAALFAPVSHNCPKQSYFALDFR